MIDLFSTTSKTPKKAPAKLPEESAEAQPAEDIFDREKKSHLSRSKLEESLITAHSEIRHLKSWAVRKKKKEVISEYLPEGKTHFDRKDIQGLLGALQKEYDTNISPGAKKEIREKMDTLKQATGFE